MCFKNNCHLKYLPQSCALFTVNGNVQNIFMQSQTILTLNTGSAMINTSLTQCQYKVNKMLLYWIAQVYLIYLGVGVCGILLLIGS